MPQSVPLMLGLSGPELTADERAWLADHRPAAFILFARNIQSPAQVQALTAELAGFSPWPQPLIAVDQEGGRVQRVKFFGNHPPARLLGDWWLENPAAALRACTLNAALMADGLRSLGATWLLGPLLDVPVPGAHDIIGNRAFGTSPQAVASLGQAFLQGLTMGGVHGCLKHAPGHGRAVQDTHHTLPHVTAPREELERTDFVPFQTLAPACPFLMTAHIRFEALDATQPATTSPAALAELQSWGGPLTTHSGQVILADDAGMAALPGTYPQRVQNALAAGCGLVITALSHVPQGMAGTVYATNDAAALRATTLPEIMPPVAQRLSHLALPPRLSRPQAEAMLTELQALWAAGPGRQHGALELHLAP